jgi:hypothetical protein
MQDTGLKIKQSLVQMTKWVTKYPRCKDFESKGEEIYEINNITELFQCPDLKINPSVA